MKKFMTWFKKKSNKCVQFQTINKKSCIFLNHVIALTVKECELTFYFYDSQWIMPFDTEEQANTAYIKIIETISQ